MKYYSYSRVSTQGQDILRQEVGIENYCKENNIFIEHENKYSDKMTGKTFNRNNYILMKQNLKEDDTVIILDLDRLGRNWDLIKQEWQWFIDNKINIIVVNMHLLNTNTSETGMMAINKKLIQVMVFELMCYMSQVEVEKISQRTKEALQAKKEQGIKLGRRRTYSDEFVDNVMKDYLAGVNCFEICNKYKISLNRIMVWRKERNLPKRTNK